MKKQFSAGGVITRKNKGTTEILLIRHLDSKLGFPKGHLEGAESEEEAAIREIKEETGYTDVVIRECLGIISRNSINSNGKYIIKDVTMFRADVKGGRRVDPEEEAVWIKIPDAVDKFWYSEDNVFFNKIKDTL